MHSDKPKDLPFANNLSSLIQSVADRIKAAGIDDARREARWLVTEVVGLESAFALANPDFVLSDDAVLEVERATARRIAKEPLSRILGVREFFGRTFELAAETLDPRPDTEPLIELALEFANDYFLDKPDITILDIGTGTGCVAITLACELQQAKIVATDISTAALATAKSNAKRHSVADRIDFIETDGCRGLTGPFDLVVSNPPYIRTSDIPHLDESVRSFDPIRALDGGADGMQFYENWTRDLKFLTPNAAIIFEVGAPFSGAPAGKTDADTIKNKLEKNEMNAIQQAETVQRLLAKRFNRPILTKKDLNGHTRCVAIAPVPQ